MTEFSGELATRGKVCGCGGCTMVARTCIFFRRSLILGPLLSLVSYLPTLESFFRSVESAFLIATSQSVAACTDVFSGSIYARRTEWSGRINESPPAWPLGRVCNG